MKELAVFSEDKKKPTGVEKVQKTNRLVPKNIRADSKNKKITISRS
jgi:hypothetical protein